MAEPREKLIGSQSKFTGGKSRAFLLWVIYHPREAEILRRGHNCCCCCCCVTFFWVQSNGKQKNRSKGERPQQIQFLFFLFFISFWRPLFYILKDQCKGNPFQFFWFFSFIFILCWFQLFGSTFWTLNRPECTGKVCSGLSLTELDWTWLNWIGMNWTGLDTSGFYWILLGTLVPLLLVSLSIQYTIWIGVSALCPMKLSSYFARKRWKSSSRWMVRKKMK